MAYNKDIYSKISAYDSEAQEALQTFERKFLELTDEYGEKEVYEAAKAYMAEEDGNFGDSVEGILADWVHDYEQ